MLRQKRGWQECEVTKVPDGVTQSLLAHAHPPGVGHVAHSVGFGRYYLITIL